MSFSRSGGTAPAFSFPIGYGTFTDVNASNAVFTSNVYSSFFIGDGGFLSNTLPSNILASNSVTTTNVVSTRLNVSSISNLNSVVSPLANIGTLNVSSISNLSSLTTNITASVANVGTLNVGQVSNLSSLSTTLYGPHFGSNVASFLNVYSANAVTTTNVFATSVVPTYPLSFRNRIINGDFIIDQRNNGASSTPGATPTKVIDRWKTEIAGSGRCLVGQNLLGVTSPVGFTSYYGMQVTTTTSVGSGDYFFLSQIIEGINTVDLVWGQASAKPVTLGFWIYSSITGTGGGFIRNAGEAGGNYSRSFPFAYTVNNTNTWEYKTVNIPGDTTGQWISDQLNGVEVGFEMWNGTTYQAPAGAWAAGNYTGPSSANIGYAGSLNSRLFITGVQFEAGPYATPFERRHIGFELAQCQRYYEPSIVRVGGYNTSGAFLRGSVYFNVKKRPKTSTTFTVVSQLENNNLGTINFDSSNYDQSSARYLSNVVTAGDAYGQWKVSVDAEF